MNYQILNSAGETLKEESRPLFVDVKEASWSWLQDSVAKVGFEFKLGIHSGDIAIDNIKVTDISGDVEQVLVEKDFNQGNQGFFTELRSNQ